MTREMRLQVEEFISRIATVYSDVLDVQKELSELDKSKIELQKKHNDIDFDDFDFDVPYNQVEWILNVLDLIMQDMDLWE